jgi:hypothetical protein
LPKKKKWSKEECRDRYVRGEKIGQRELSKQSGRHETVIARWCSQEKWVQQRQQYVSRLQVETESKTIQKTSDRLSDELAKLNEEHIKGSELFRKMAQQFAGIMAAEIQNSSNEKRFEKLTDKEFSLAIQRYSTIFATAVQLQRQATGMQYLDLDKAVSEVIKAGYDVSESEE